jgi:hypothetical protein
LGDINVCFQQIYIANIEGEKTLNVLQTAMNTYKFVLIVAGSTQQTGTSVSQIDQNKQKCY